MSRNDKSISAYHDNENQRRYIEHENEWAHSEAGQYEISYNDARNEEIHQRDIEIGRRNMEIMNNLKKFYISKNSIFILILSVILTFLTVNSTNFSMGFIGWNIVIFIVLGFFFYITAKSPTTHVRSEIKDRTYFIQQSAKKKAYRK